MNLILRFPTPVIYPKTLSSVTLSKCNKAMLECPPDSSIHGNDIVRNPTQARDTLDLEVAKPNLPNTPRFQKFSLRIRHFLRFWYPRITPKNAVFLLFFMTLGVVSSCGHLDASRLLDEETKIALNFQDKIHLFNPFGS